AIAAARLVELGPARTVPTAVRDAWLASRDAALRGYGVEVLFQHATPDSVALLAKQLGDPHPAVRNKARRALHERAVKSGQRKEVIEHGTKALAGETWQAQEQAAVLLANLRHQPAAARMVELLSADRPEVFVTAAWGLRRLSVPSSLPGALA